MQVAEDAAEPEANDGEALVTLEVGEVEVSDEVALSPTTIESMESKTAEATGEEPVAAEAGQQDGDHCEDDTECVVQVVQSSPADELAIEIPEAADAATPEPEMEPLPVEAEGDVSPELPVEIAEPEPLENEVVASAGAQVSVDAAPEAPNLAAAATVEEAADGAKAVPPAQPGNSPKSPPGLEHAPGQQPVHPNPVAAAARENAPPFSGDGDAHQHPQHPEHPQHPQNPSHAQEAKAAAPGQIRAAEARQPTAPAPEAPAPIQSDPATSAATYQAARTASANFDPAILQPAGGGRGDPVPLNGNAVALEIVSRMRDGLRRFDIRLDPPELGRVEVRLDVDRHGQVTTRLTVDRPETLELMQREARGLERALQQAGLKTDEGGLQFSLRQQSDNFAQAEYGPGRNPDVSADEIDVSGGAIESYRAAIFARGGVDIRV